MTKFTIPEPMAQWLASIQDEAYQRGHEEGYQKGWDEATAALVEAAKEKRVTPAHTPQEPRVSEQPLSIRTRVRASDFEDLSYKQRIVSALRESPGLRAADIARRLKALDPRVNENSVKTTIKRMKNKEIRQTRNKKWLLNEDHSQEAA